MDQSEVSLPDTLTDEDVAKLEAEEAIGQQAKASSEVPDVLTDEEVFKLEEEEALNSKGEKPEFFRNPLDWYESRTGAPSRAFVDAAVDGKNPLWAFYKQWGENPNSAPDFKDTSEKLGVSSDPVQIGGRDIEISPNYNPYGVPEDEIANPYLEPTKIVPSEVVGFAGNMGLDWSNLVGSGLYKGAGKLFGTAAKKALWKSVALPTEGVLKTGAAGIDAVTGGKSAKQSLEGLANTVVPNVAPDYADFAQIARNNGIDPDLLPSPVKYGDESFLSMADRSVAEGPVGEPLRRKWNFARDSVDSAIDNRINVIGDGRPLSQPEAGNYLRESFNTARDNFFKQMDWTYSTVYNQVPGMKIHPMAKEILDSKLAGAEKYAKGLELRAIGTDEITQANQLNNAIAGIRNSKNVKQMYEALQRIRRYAYPKRGEFTFAATKPDIQNMRDLYAAVQKSIVDTTRLELGPNIANQLEANNKAMVNWFKDERLIESALDPDAAGEKVFKDLIFNGDSRQIQILKKRLPQEDINRLKGAFLQSLLKPAADGNTLLGSLRQAMHTRKNQIDALFTPEEAKGIRDLVALGERVGTHVISHSGTGPSNAFRKLLEGAWDGLVTSNIVEAMKKSADSAEALRLNPTPVEDRLKGFLKDSFSGPKTAFGDSAGANASKLGAGAGRALNIEVEEEKRKRESIPPALLPSIPPQSKMKIEGFDPSKTIQLDPLQAMQVDAEIKSSPTSSNIEKAKKLRLLRKHGRIVLDA